jgi:hypothetical protein
MRAPRSAIRSRTVRDIMRAMSLLLAAVQVEDHFRKQSGPMGAEFERICQLGSITPDAWMRQAVGAPLSADALLAATSVAYDKAKAPR